MKSIHSNNLLTLTFCFGIFIVSFSSAVNAGDFECMLVQARLIESVTTEKPSKDNPFPIKEVVLEGINFGPQPMVYFGENTEPVTLTEVGQSNNLDTITLKLPEGTPAGTYKLIIQNTTGPFLDGDGKVNPIFCFGSVTIGYVSGGNNS